MKIINLIFILVVVSFAFHLSYANNIDINKYFNELQGQIGYEGTDDVVGQSNSIEDLESKGNAHKEDSEEENKCTKKSCNVKNIFGNKASQERQQKAEETGINRNKSGFLDKAINLVKNAKNNNEFGYLNGEQESCEDKEETIESSKTEKCDEYYTQEQSSCFPKQVVEIDPKYHYGCHKKRDVKEKICEDRITNIKCKQSKECDLGGIEPDSIASDMMIHSDKGVLTIGTIALNYWSGNCNLYDKNTTFKIKNLRAIKDFTIFNVGFDDYMEIFVNGVSVYAGPDGGKDLKVVWKKIGFRGNTPYINNGHHDKHCERNTDRNFTVNIDLKPYLREGENSIRIKVFVTGYGEGWLKIRAKQNCCSNWDITREEKCRLE